MKKMAMFLIIGLCFGTANAGVIHDLQIGEMYTEGDWILVEGAVVTASAYYGVAIAEEPYGPGNSVWVYLGSEHGILVGDLVNCYGVYEEYYDLTEINVKDYEPDSFFDVFSTGPVPPPIAVSAGDIMTDPEPFESSIVLLPDGFIVTEMLSYGEWTADTYSSRTTIHFDDFWFDETVLDVGICAQNATGMWTYSYGAFKLEPFADGFPIDDCWINNETITFGAIKAMYR